MKYQTLFETVKEAIEKVKNFYDCLDYEWWFNRYNEIRCNILRICVPKG